MTAIQSYVSAMDGVVLALGIAWVVYLCLLARRAGPGRVGRIPHPPGPRGLPIVGNMFQIPQKDEWPVYEAWARKYGPITYLTILGTPMIVLNSLKVARDLMEERSAIYSDRPLMAIKELCTLDWVLTYIPSSASSGPPHAHRLRRAAVQRYFSGPASVKHRIYQQEESHSVLAHNLLKRPEGVEGHVKQHTSNSILLGTYGYRVSSADDPIVREMERSFEKASMLSGPIAFLVEALPSWLNLKTWPWTMLLRMIGIGKILSEITETFEACRVEPYVRSKRMIDDGSAVPCFVSTSLDDIAADSSLSRDEAHQKEELLMDCAAVMYGAATDSTTSTLRTFFYLMALHPHIAKTAQAELDKVTEGERLPTFADWDGDKDGDKDGHKDGDRLPYVRAVILEVLRYNTVTPLGLPHALAQDDVYNGMLLPKGSMVCVNLWLIYRDPDIFKDPDTFNPDRFMGEDGARCREILNLAWGMGRRSCPGRQFAETALFITVSTVLSCFDISPKMNTDGTAPELRFHDGFIRRPVVFPVDIVPRSSKWAEIIEKEHSL